ncbi:MAG: cell wall hydrolase [Eubacteriales bacterium]|nr:cell wall hydrolase [Eubacteriales bacterium]
MKKTGRKGLWRRFFLAALVVALCTNHTALTAQADKIKEIQDQIDDAKENKEAAENQKEETEKNIGSLNSARDSLQGQLDGLTQDLTEISQRLEEIEQNVIDKNEEIADTQEKLDQAKETEARQYADMKKRIRYLYRDNNRTYLEILFRARSFSDMLNQSIYIEKLHEYDRNLLLTYKAQREAIEELEAQLEEEKEQLEELQAQAETEKANITASVNKTKSGISAYSGQIADAQAQADALADQIEAQNENIAALQKQLQEEIAKSRLAANSKWRDISEVTFTEDDRYLLANLIYCEAGNQPYEGQVAVGAVVINRVLSSVYPNTVSSVIYQYKQFAPVLDGHLSLALAQNRATASCYKAADEAMAGYTNVGRCVYFRTPIPGLTGIQIGDHIFY